MKDIKTTDTDKMTDKEFAAWVNKVTDALYNDKSEDEIEKEAGLW